MARMQRSMASKVRNIGRAVYTLAAKFLAALLRRGLTARSGELEKTLLERKFNEFTATDV